MPKAALTTESVTALPHHRYAPRTKIYDAPQDPPPKRKARNRLYPGDVRGFFVRIGRTPAHFTYYLDYHDHTGKRHTLKVAKGTADPDFARELAQQLLVKISKGADPAGERIADRRKVRDAKGQVLRTYLEGDYDRVVLKHRKSGKATKKRIESAWSDILDKNMAVITPRLVDGLLADREVTPLTKSRDLTALKAVLSRAARDGVIDRNPLERHTIEAADNKRVRWIGQDDAEERARFLKALNEEATQGYLRCLVVLAMHTGMRRGELFSLEWRDVNLRQGTITLRVETTKASKVRHIPLNPHALKVLKDWKGRKIIPAASLVFPNEDTGKRMDNIKRSWGALLKRAEVGNLRFHDLRHDFASQLRQKGAALELVRDALGHSSITLTERYAHVGERELRDAVSLLAE